MSKSMTWLRDYFVLPLLVGLIVFGLTYIIPALSQPKRELSYSVSPQEILVDFTQLNGVEVQINGEGVASLNSSTVRIWNSGNQPINDIGILVSFSEKIDNLNIVAIYHNTTPQKEFGRINQVQVDDFSIRFVYELLNSSDSDMMTIVTQRTAEIEIFAKQEGLTIKNVATTSSQTIASYLQWILAIVAAIASLFSLGIRDSLSDFLRLTRRYDSRKKTRNIK